MFSKLIVPLAASLALTVATGCGFHKSPEERIDDTLAKLNATDAQKKTVHAAFDDVMSKASVSKADRTVLKGRIVEQLKGEKPDAAVVEESAASIVTSGLSVAHAFVDDAARVHDTLTKQQRAQLVDELKPGTGMRAGFFVADRMGYGPPADAKELKARAEKHIDEHLAKLDATDAQRAQLKKLAVSLVDEAAPIVDDRDEVKKELVDAWNSDKVDVKGLHALVDVEGQKIEQLARDAAQKAVEAHAILTPAQRAKIIGRAL